MYLQLDISLILFQTEKHSEIVKEISRLNDRLREAQRNNAKAGESNEDSLDAFMSNLNTSTLSKSDMTKMKVELQNLRREEMNLVKLINLTKPANLPPLVSQVQAEAKKDDLQQKSKSMRKVSQLERRRKIFEANVSNLFSSFLFYVKMFLNKCFLFMIKKRYILQNKGDSERNSSLYSNDTMDNEEEEEEEDAQEEENKEDNVITKEEENTDVHKSECKKSTLYKDETEPSDSVKTDDKPCTTKSVNQETRKQNVNAAESDKKRKKDSKSEKSKNRKKQYDQDVHSEDYSTWVPPRNQAGDGRTNLNDKYGY